MSAEKNCLLSTVYFSRVAHAHYALIPFVKELRLVGGRLREGGWRVGFMFRDLKIFSGRISSLC